MGLTLDKVVSFACFAVVSAHLPSMLYARENGWLSFISASHVEKYNQSRSLKRDALTLVPASSCEGSLREALRAVKALLFIRRMLYFSFCLSFPKPECLCKNVGKRFHLLCFVSAVFIWHK